MARAARIGSLLILLLVAASAAAADDTALERRLRSFVSERAGVDRADVLLPPLSDFSLPAGHAQPVEVRLSARPDQDFSGSAPVTVSLVSEGRELKRGSVNVRVRRDHAAFVAARALPARSVIGPGDVIPARVGTALPVDAISDPQRIVGRQTTRSIAPGTPWRESLVAAAPVVSRGELVKVQLVSGGLRIDGVARASRDAAPGERIRVLNVESRRELVGVVGEDGVVHVGH